MMRLLPLAPLLLCGVIAAENVLGQAALPDGAALLTKTRQGIWQQMLDLPSMVAMQRLSLQQSGIEVPEGDSPWDASPFPRAFDLAVLHAEPGAVPRLVVRADYGEQADAAETMWSTLLEQLGASGMTLPGALRRVGTRLEFDDGDAVAWPESPAVGSDDAVAVIHTDAMARAFGMLGERVQRAFALGPWRIAATVTPQRYRESADLAGRWPAFAPVDVAQLRGVPRQALFAAAIGLDGFALEEWSLEVGAALPEFTLGLATLDERCAEQGLPPFTDALFGANGTAWIAVLPGAPFPSVTIAVPGGTGVDAFIDALGEQAGIDLAAARQSAVMLPIPGMPVPLMLRRNPSHWLLSSDLLGIDDLAAGTGAPFATDGIDDLAAGATPIALIWSDNRLMFQQLAGFMALGHGALAGQGDAEVIEQFRVTTQAIRDLATLIPPSLGVFTRDEQALHVRGENLAFNAGVWVGIGAGAAVPVILQTQSRSREVRSQNNMKQLVTAMIAWSIDHDGSFPPSFAVLAQDLDLPPAVLRSPLADVEAPTPHYLYVRPHGDVPPWQPVVLEDPAHHPHGVLLYSAADSSSHLVRGDNARAIWAEAQRLANLDKAAAAGIAGEDWAAVEALLNP